LAHALGPTVRAGFAEPSPAVWKAALHRLGAIAHDGVRAPMTGASPAAADALLATLP
jgi:dihydrodipicolinate synthase/N-acetylneuraminate lyase